MTAARARQVQALARLALIDLYRRKDLVVVFLLALLILGPLAFLKPYGLEGAARYLHEIALLLLWLASGILSLGVAARQFPPEFESRTIYPLLAKPVTRGTLLLGKYLGAGAASLSVLAVFYLAYGVMTGLRQGVWFPEVLLQAIVLHAGCVLVVTALGMLGSLVLTPAANLTIGGIVTVAMLIGGQRLPLLAAEQPEPLGAVLTAIHWIAPHVEFFDLRQRVVHAWPPISWKICLAALAYAVGYAGLCLTLAHRVFHRRQL